MNKGLDLMDFLLSVVDIASFHLGYPLGFCIARRIRDGTVDIMKWVTLMISIAE
jgi:hypothetical protein